MPSLLPGCRVMGSVSLQPQGSAAQEGRIQEVDHSYPKLSPGWVSECQAVRKMRDTAQGVGKHSLRHGIAVAGLGVPGPAGRLGPSGSQNLGNPGAAGCRQKS